MMLEKLRELISKIPCCHCLAKTEVKTEKTVASGTGVVNNGDGNVTAIGSNIHIDNSKHGQEITVEKNIDTGNAILVVRDL